MFASKVTFFEKKFNGASPKEPAEGVKKKFQKTLILAFEVIMQLPEYT